METGILKLAGLPPTGHFNMGPPAAHVGYLRASCTFHGHGLVCAVITGPKWRYYAGFSGEDGH